MKGIFSAGLMEIVLIYFPSIIMLMISSFSMQNLDKFTRRSSELGKKIGKIDRNKSMRLFLIIPINLFCIFYVVEMIVLFQYMLIINICIVFTSMTIVFIYEKKNISGKK